MFIYMIFNDIYYDKVLKLLVVIIWCLLNDKEVIYNNIRILIVYRIEIRIFVIFLKWFFFFVCVLICCWIKGYICLEFVYVKKFFIDERKLKWSLLYDKWIN